MPRKVFTAGEILTAANLNDVSDQTVMVFDDATDRATAIPTPVEGMVTYLKDTDEVDKFDGSAFVPVGIAPAILQVVSTTLTTPFTASLAQGAKTEITGLTASITPSATSSKILVFASVQTGNTLSTNYSNSAISLFRGASEIGVGDTSGSRQTVSSGSTSGVTTAIQSSTAQFLDSPSTTSSTTYSVKVSHTLGATDTVTVNRSRDDSDSSRFPRGASTITVMEVAG